MAWDNVIQDTINGYVAIETAKVGAGLAATTQQQAAGLGAVPVSAQSQAQTVESEPISWGVIGAAAGVLVLLLVLLVRA